MLMHETRWTMTKGDEARVCEEIKLKKVTNFTFLSGWFLSTLHLKYNALFSTVVGWSIDVTTIDYYVVPIFKRNVLSYHDIPTISLHSAVECVIYLYIYVKTHVGVYLYVNRLIDILFLQAVCHKLSKF